MPIVQQLSAAAFIDFATSAMRTETAQVVPNLGAYNARRS